MVGYSSMQAWHCEACNWLRQRIFLFSIAIWCGCYLHEHSLQGRVV
jgi:hypothetical protein